MSDRTDDLRAIGEDLIADAKELQQLEERKLELSADDQQTARLSSESEVLIREMGKKAQLEGELADQPDDR